MPFKLSMILLLFNRNQHLFFKERKLCRLKRIDVLIAMYIYYSIVNEPMNMQIASVFLTMFSCNLKKNRRFDYGYQLFANFTTDLW